MTSQPNSLAGGAAPTGAGWERAEAFVLPLIRVAALCVFLIGVYFFIRRLPETAQDLFAREGGDWPTRLAAMFGELGGTLTYCAWGGLTFVATQISFGKPKRRTPLDFDGQLGEFIYKERPERRNTRRVLGLVSIIAGPLLSMVGNSLIRGAKRADVPIVEYASIALGLVIVYIAMWIFLTGMRRLAPRAETLLRRNPRRPILYLRSFGRDARYMDPGGCGQLPRLLILGPFGHQTVEHSLAFAINDFRPLVAIGQPGEQLPPLGAARLYVAGDADWQQVVAEMTKACPLVILRIGATPGFWWEIEHLVDAYDPQRVLIYLPRQDRNKTYKNWREKASQYFPHPLPYSVGGASFLGFGPDWEPQLYGAGRRSLGALLRLPFGGRAPEVREALNGALRQLGARPTKLPLLGREWFFYTLLLAIIMIWFVMPATLGS
jgi:hypothetical protein